MIYWLQEATTAGSQGGGPSWLLSAGIIGATVSLIGLIFAQLRHTQSLRQTRELEDKRTLEARDLETLRAGEAALQKYFEQVGKLLIEQHLHDATSDDNLSTVIRAQTLVVLRGLDPDRKRILLQFLYESNLINVDKPVIKITWGNLRWAYLERLYLRGAYLSRANLDRANLMEANLAEADLFGADLSGANLFGADLSGANLSEANTLTQEQINEAYGDEHTKLPNYLQRPAHWIKGE